MCSVRF